METLKKAEQAKRDAEGSLSAPALETVVTASPASGTELSLVAAHVDAIETPLQRRDASPPLRSSPASEVTCPAGGPPDPSAAPMPPADGPVPGRMHQRWAARSVFMAEHPPRDWRSMGLHSVLLVLGVASATIYLQARASATTNTFNSVLPGMAVSKRAVDAAVQVPDMPAPEPAEPIPSPADPANEPTESAIEPAERPVNRDRTALEGEMTAAQAQQDEATITVTRRAFIPRSDALITDGYTAYQKGDMHIAHLAYWDALRTDPNNRDALLGLAAISAETGARAQAREFYLRLLDRDPRDPLALAGLLNLEEPGDPRAQQTRVKLSLAQHQDAAHLHAALGHLYAREQRWAEARAAYARALALDQRDALAPREKNPDFAFNLAVSEEHLGQRAAAIESYGAALAYASRRRPGFDPALAEARVRALSTGTGQ
jgi:tetratricopeptide (TPR) repeat protein